MVISAVGLTSSEANPWLIALVAATAATAGRVTLAKMACIIVRQRWLSARTKENIDLVKDRLAAQPAMTFSGVLAYTCSPLPSNSLFMAYGLTSLPLTPVAAAAFIGRFVTYSVWVFMAMEVAHTVMVDQESIVAYFGGYFVLTQVLMLALVYLFAKLDWKVWFASKTLKLMSQTGNSSRQ
jgi:membrane protein YqaA with SNARE-associated domain